MTLYGLIGHPIAHSLSATLFNGHFITHDIDARYLAFDLPSIQDFPATLRDNPNLRGLNVTAPYKEEVIPFLDELTPEAQEVRAVNCIEFRETTDGLRLVGHNTDIFGFSSEAEHIITPDTKDALILGTGGAARAVKKALTDMGLRCRFVSRSQREGQLTYSSINEEDLTAHALLVNATPNHEPSFPYHFIRPDIHAVDLTYNPLETPFLRHCRLRGASTHCGLQMLLYQAQKSALIWGIRH